MKWYDLHHAKHELVRCDDDDDDDDNEDDDNNNNINNNKNNHNNNNDNIMKVKNCLTFALVYILMQSTVVIHTV